MKTEAAPAAIATSCYPAQCVVAIATSAGGLHALSVILSGLPVNFILPLDQTTAKLIELASPCGS